MPLNFVEIQSATGLLKLTFLTKNIVRIRYAPSGELSPHRSWSVVPKDEQFNFDGATVKETQDSLMISSSEVTAHVKRESQTVQFLHKSGKSFACDLTKVTNNTNAAGEKILCLEKKLETAEYCYGFGERAQPLQRRGFRFTNMTEEPKFGHDKEVDNMYQAHPTMMVWQPGFTWGMYLNSTHWSQFDVGAEKKDVFKISTAAPEIDVYLFAGPEPKDVVEQLVTITGSPALPPLWSLGYHQSRWGYESQDAVKKIVDQFRAKQIPLDVMHLDIDHMDGFRTFTWQKEKFSEPKKLISELNGLGVKAITILDPGLKVDPEYHACKDLLQIDGAVKDSEGRNYEGYCWPDSIYFPDFTKAAVRNMWADKCAHWLKDNGLSGLWQDMNEPTTFLKPFSEGLSTALPLPKELKQGDTNEPTTHAEVRNLYATQMAQAAYEGSIKARPNERPWVLSRSGFCGVQKWAMTWMGDNSSWWEHLKMSLPQCASMGLSGSPFIGVDIGGFFENSNAELYARWIQMGTFYPFMRTHTSFLTEDQEPWSFGDEVEEIARQSIVLRYELLPYIYQNVLEGHRKGTPVLRPMFFEFSQEEAFAHCEDQMMFGSSLLVAPVMEPNVRKRKVMFPKNTEWFDFWTGNKVTVGNQTETIDCDAPLNRIPLFVRTGTCVPMGQKRMTTDTPLVALRFLLAPSEKMSEFLYEEDDGHTFDYLQGKTCQTRIKFCSSAKETSIHLDERYGSYKPTAREIRFEVCSTKKPSQVLKDGQPLACWDWNQQRNCCLLGFCDDGRAHNISLLF